jgi:hypothetical protein
MPVRRFAATMLTIAALTIWATTAADSATPEFAIGAFSTMQPGAPFDGNWKITRLPGIEPARFSVEVLNDARVIRIDAASEAASLTRNVTWDLAALPRLTWQWRVDRVISKSDPATKSGDDFAARLYVMFDLPIDSLPLVDRTKLKLARWLYGDDLPTAALCYVWGNRSPVGTQTWNAFTDRVRMIVLRNGDDSPGSWALEHRDIAADFRQAFGVAPPPPLGIAIAADTDQTGETVTAWFADISATR